VNIQQLRPEQHAMLKAQVEAQFQYWERLLGRLDQRRFPRDGEFFQTVLKAHRAAHKVWEYIEFHRPQSGPEDGELPF
jgi:hypothetical protein